MKSSGDGGGVGDYGSASNSAKDAKDAETPLWNYAVTGPNDSRQLNAESTLSSYSGSVSKSQLGTTDMENLPSFLAERASVVMTKDTKSVRGSILAEGFTQQIQPIAGKAQARAVTNAFMMQVLAFFSLVAFSGVTPTIMQSLMGKDSSGHQATEFLPFMPFFVDYVYSIILGNVCSLIFYGTQGLKSCWDVPSILIFSVPMFFASTSEPLQMLILKHLDGTSWRIIKQLKLPMTAVGVYAILGRRTTTPPQWAIIVCVCFSVFGYCMQSAKGKAGTSWTGILLALLSISLTTFGGISGDYTYKSVPFPMCTQIAQGRLTSIVVALVITFAECSYSGTCRKFPFGGYSWGLVAFSSWLTLKDWTGSYVLKHLDSLWKCLAGVLTVCVAYFLDLYFGKRQFETIALCFVLVVMGNIFAFALTKREQAEMTRLRGLPTTVKCS